MEEIKGKINTAISFAKTIDENARAQIAQLRLWGHNALYGKAVFNHAIID